MANAPQAGAATERGNKQRTETVAFRTTRVGKRLIEAAASNRDELPSDWLRREAARGIQRDLGLRVGTVEEGDANGE